MLESAARAGAEEQTVSNLEHSDMIGNLVSAAVFWAVYALLVWCVINFV